MNTDVYQQDGLVYRPLVRTDVAAARTLMRQVFDRFNASAYTRQGRESFYSFISLHNLENGLDRGWIAYGCYQGPRIVGVIMMNSPNHISELFVDAAFQKRGIGAHLIALASGKARQDPRFFGQISVNASEYASAFYRRLGFEASAPLRIEGGIRYLPMIKKVEP